MLDAGLSPADVAQMRRQFYEGRGEEVPEGLEGGGIGQWCWDIHGTMTFLTSADDENARALEEQWIEGEMTNDTATSTSFGMTMFNVSCAREPILLDFTWSTHGLSLSSVPLVLLQGAATA